MALSGQSAFAQAEPGGTCAQQVNTGYIASATEAEIVTWGQLLYTRMDTGVPDTAAATFGFSDPCVQSDLFSPLRGARTMLETIGVLDGGACDNLGDFTLSPELNLNADQLVTLRAYFEDGNLVTNIFTQPSQTLTLFGLASEAIYEEDVTVLIDGELLIVTGLNPPATGGGPAPWTEAAQNVSPETSAFLLALAGNTQQLVAQVYTNSAANDQEPGWGTHEALKLITGEASRADLVAQAIGLYASNMYPTLDVTVDRIDACWGTYGSMPLAVVIMPDAVMLVDTTSGRAAGPFEPGSDLDARGLLGLDNNKEGLWNGTNPEYYNRQGCQVAAPPKWYPTPPAAPDRRTPAVPGTPTAPPAVEGGNQLWDCKTEPLTQVCVCTRTESWDTGPTPPILVYYVDVRCRYDPLNPPQQGCGLPGPAGPTPPSPGPGSPAAVCEYKY